MKTGSGFGKRIFPALRSVLVVCLSFLLVFGPFADGVTPVLASQGSKRGHPEASESTPVFANLLSGTASYFASMLSSPEISPKISDDVTLQSIMDNTYQFADKLLEDERISDALLMSLEKVSIQEGESVNSIPEEILIQILRDDDLHGMLGDVIASLLLLEEGTPERDFAQQMAGDVYALLQDDSDGSFKAFLRDALNEFANDDRVSEVTEDVLFLLVSYTGDVLANLESAGSFAEISNLLSDFVDYMRGSKEGTEIATVVAGALDNLADIPAGFVEALREDESFNRAMDNLGSVFWDALLDPMFGDLEGAGVLEDYLGELVSPDCSSCEEGDPQPGCAQCGGGL